MDTILKVMRRIRLVVGLLVLLVAVAFVALVTRGTEPHGADQSPLSRQVAADITPAPGRNRP